MMRRGRLAGLLALAVALVAPCAAEIVKVTADHTTIYDSESRQSQAADISGKRFMVYGVSKDWCLVEMTIKGVKQLRWIPKADVAVDWGDAKVVEATVAAVPDVNSVELSNGTRVQFRGVRVPPENVALARQTLARLRQLLQGKRVLLEFDTTDRNERGQLEAYVYVDGAFVNRLLVEYGLATVVGSAERGRYDAVLSYNAKQAAEAKLGIWAEPETTTPEREDTSRADSQDSTATAPRRLTPAQWTQWALRLQVQVEVLSERVDADKTDDGDDGCSTTTPGARADDAIASSIPPRLRSKDFDGVVPAG